MTSSTKTELLTSTANPYPPLGLPEWRDRNTAVGLKQVTEQEVQQLVCQLVAEHHIVYGAELLHQCTSNIVIFILLVRFVLVLTTTDNWFTKPA